MAMLVMMAMILMMMIMLKMLIIWIFNLKQIIMPAGSVEERAQRIRNLGAECTILEVSSLSWRFVHYLGGLILIFVMFSIAPSWRSLPSAIVVFTILEVIFVVVNIIIIIMIIVIALLFMFFPFCNIARQVNYDACVLLASALAKESGRQTDHVHRSIFDKASSTLILLNINVVF